MLKELGIYKGVNLGGWLSQCDYSEERLNTFITEADFREIAALGFDHVRIPVDYNVIQNEDGSAKEDGLQRLDRAFALCGQYGLKAVLDLHKTPASPLTRGSTRRASSRMRHIRRASTPSGRPSPPATA